MPPKALPYHPKQGEVLRCDFSGLVPPEMDKVRWVVVLSPKFVGRRNLATVIPLSTTPPPAIEAFHVKLDKDPAPNASGDDVWAKCDMVMTVSFARLSAYWTSKDGGRRNYVSLHISPLELGKIRQATLAGIGLGYLWK
ncbi:type II toxin-antitoxin system PemK/MazF family toxin [Hydrogenophaga sp. Root209]|uniref:type II toxin-antitoxin system PemK/MazF family toxin n=1 Tax=Hydrogenophaga sp. Root209 TaxID=1736490 RepID=UPI0009E9F0F9